jgi:hypothetical protein
MGLQYGDAIRTGLGPINQPLGTPVNTQPATGTGIFNNTVSAAATKVLSASASPQNKVRRVKIVAPLAGTNLAWTTVKSGAPAPTLTAYAGGVQAATDGSLIEGGGGAEEWFSIPDTLDLYLAASAATTPYNMTVVED